MASLATLQTRLDQAEEAYHQLMLGTAVRVFVDQNGERIEYFASDKAKLAAYIKQLKFQIDNSSQEGPMGITLC